MKKLSALALCLLFMFLAPRTLATEAARDITGESKITVEGYRYPGFLYDKDTYNGYASKGNVTVTLENPQGIGSLYFLFDWEYGEYTLTDNTTGKTHTAGTHRFLHEFVDLEEAFGAAPTSVTVAFDRGTVTLVELYAFSRGQTPDFVQKWQPPLEGGADILMLPTHGDDDQLYFAGLLPRYAGEEGLRVQVAYMTSHRNYTTLRTHEMLNGLWAVGVDAYPVFGEFFDFRNDSLAISYQVYANHGITRDDLVAFVTEQLRRFKPLAVVGHDINGEYGHGMHKMYCDALMEAVERSMDPEAFPGSAQRYGVWDVPKTYLHLLEDNPIVVDYDTPLDAFGGLTAFQVTQKLGFPCHETQQVYGFKTWLNGAQGEITRADQIETYNPSYFGLLRTTVGPDVLKNDFMENLVSYDRQARLEAERLEAERLEQERLEAERLEAQRQEALRLEQERLEKERQEAARLEAERLEAERLAQEAQRLEEEARLKKRLLALLTMVLALTVLLITLGKRKKSKKTRK